MSVESRVLWGRILAGLGVFILLIEIVLHVISFYMQRQYELNHAIMLIGVIIGFVGFYMLDPTKAKEGASVMSSIGIDIIKALPRFGRRSTDAVAVPTAETKVTALPTPSDSPHAQPNGDGGTRG